MERLFFAFCLFLSTSLLTAQPLNFEVSSEAALLINADTGRLLFGKNKDQLLFPASVTKVATALYVLKMYEARLNEKVIAKREALASITPQAKKQSNYRCPAYWLDTDGSHIGIKVGEEFPLKTLLIAMLVASANDAANVMAEHLEGSIPKFMDKLNQYLKDLGCKNTVFYNPHGLHHPQHKTTAEDLALIAKNAMQNPLFRQIVAMTSFVCPRTNLSEERYLTQTNHLLRHGPHYYKKAIGIKTGSTSQAGKTLIAGAKNSDRNLIAVVLGSPSTVDRYADVTKMFEKTFNEKKLRYSLLPSGVQKFKLKVPSGKSPLLTYLKDPLYYDFYPSEQCEVKAKILWALPKLPIAKDQFVGEAVAFDTQGNIVSKAPIYALENVEPTFTYQLKRMFIDKKKIFFKIGLVLAGIMVLIFVWFRHRGTGHRRKTQVL